MAQIELKPLPPAEAIAYFRKKGLKASFAWQDVWQEEHAKAFTVAKAMRSSILQDIRDAVDQALADGTTFEAFKAALRPKLEAQGWWGKQAMTDPLTGETREVQLGSPRRLRTIFDVNMRTAYAAGRWERIQDVKDTLPYLKYQTVEDDRVRPEHAAWDGTILPADDDWWDTHYPPCDWGCRCTTIQMSERDAKDEGGVTDKPVAFPMKGYTNPRTGEVVRVEGGIGPGWGYNVGKAYLEQQTPSPMGPPDDGAAGEDADGASAHPRRVVTPAEHLLPADTTPAEAEAAFLGGFGASPHQARIFADKTGDGLVVGPGLFRNSVGRPVTLDRGLLRALPLVGQALREPAEIWRAWRSGPEGASLLTRRYIAHFEVDGRPIDVVVDWANGGWWATTSFAGGVDLAKMRKGDLAWSAS
ncbi:MAG TPA: phage minor head protein [Caulobacteraceae bacterium]|nr:phage minor head protein [Caulobacteraceae bacterium]